MMCSVVVLLLPSNENVLLPNNSIFTLSACFDILLTKKGIFTVILCAKIPEKCYFTTLNDLQQGNIEQLYISVAFETVIYLEHG